MRTDAASGIDTGGMRERVGARVQGIHRRVTRARAMLSPRTYVANPWIRFATAVAVGYQFGCRGHPRPVTKHASRPETILQSLLRAALQNVATSVLRDVMREVTTGADVHAGGTTLGASASSSVDR